MSGFPEQVNLILKGKVEALEIKSIRHRTLMANYFVIDLNTWCIDFPFLFICVNVIGQAGEV